MSTGRGWLAQMRGYMASQKAAGAKITGGSMSPGRWGAILIGFIAFIISTILMGFAAFGESDIENKVKDPCCPNWNDTACDCSAGTCPAAETAAGLCSMCQALVGEINYSRDMGIAAFVISILTFLCMCAEAGIAKSGPESKTRQDGESAMHAITPSFYSVLLALSAVLVGHRAARAAREAWEIAKNAGATLAGDCAFKPANLEDDDEGWGFALGTVICVCVYIVLRACLDTFYTKRQEKKAEAAEEGTPMSSMARITNDGYTAVPVEETVDEPRAPITVGARRRTTSPDGGAEATTGASSALGGKREGRSGRGGAALGSLVF